MCGIPELFPPGRKYLRESGTCRICSFLSLRLWTYLFLDLLFSLLCSLSLSICVSLSFFLYLSFPLSLSLSVSQWNPVSASHSFSLSLSLPLSCLCFSLPLALNTLYNLRRVSAFLPGGQKDKCTCSSGWWGRGCRFFWFFLFLFVWFFFFFWLQSGLLCFLFFW